MKVTVARTLDDFMKVMVIRGIIFIGEHGHRYNMEFDEHELSNRTHMLALDDTNEPIGIMRVLKDGKDAKFERLAVMPEYRKKGVTVNIVKAGIEYCKTQGIENIYLFCEPQLEKYWSKQNFTRICGGKILKYRGLDLVPVMKKVNESTPITAAERNKIPPILLQQKGEWVLPPEEKMKLLIIKKQRKQHL